MKNYDIYLRFEDTPDNLLLSYIELSVRYVTDVSILHLSLSASIQEDIVAGEIMVDDVVAMQLDQCQGNIVDNVDLDVVGKGVAERSRNPVRLSSIRRMGLELLGSCTTPTIQGCFNSCKMALS